MSKPDIVYLRAEEDEEVFFPVKIYPTLYICRTVDVAKYKSSEYITVLRENSGEINCATRSVKKAFYIRDKFTSRHRVRRTSSTLPKPPMPSVAI